MASTVALGVLVTWTVVVTVVTVRSRWTRRRAERAFADLAARFDAPTADVDR